jgi:hypothetical protein
MVPSEKCVRAATQAINPLRRTSLAKSLMDAVIGVEYQLASFIGG